MYYDGRYMDGCPIDVCDPSQVKIRDLQGGHVGKPNVFHGKMAQQSKERGKWIVNVCRNLLLHVYV